MLISCLFPIEFFFLQFTVCFKQLTVTWQQIGRQTLKDLSDLVPAVVLLAGWAAQADLKLLLTYSVEHEKVISQTDCMRH